MSKLKDLAERMAAHQAVRLAEQQRESPDWVLKLFGGYLMDRDAPTKQQSDANITKG
jgi:hypothetical protein